jgi:hypothetical protein
MARLRDDMRTAFDREQGELGDVQDARYWIVRNALSAPVRKPSSRLQLAAALATILIAAIIVGTFLALRSTTHPRSVPAGPHPPKAGLPSNGWIAYSTGNHGKGFNWGSAPPNELTQGSDIYIVREGGLPRLIAGREGGNVRNFCPAFSPDGELLAYGQEVNPGTRYLVVVALNAGGAITASTRMKVPRTGQDVCVRWSADGSRLAFVDAGKVEVRLLDGSTPASVPYDPSVRDFDLEDPTLLSPSGEWTAGADCSDATPPDKLILESRRGRANVDVPLPGCPYSIVTWAPDGRKVLVVQDIGGAFVIMAVSVDEPSAVTVVVPRVVVNGERSWPGRGDMSWQPVYR